MTTATTIDKITLTCTIGGSNKQYTMWLEEKDGGWSVQYQYGPIGGWVRGGTKTASPVALEKAKKIYDGILKEQRSKGYVQGDDAPAFSQTEGAVDSGLRPMLLTPDEEENLEKYIKDPEWGAQQKLNGKRIMIRVKGQKVEGINKSGLLCPIPKIIESAFASLKKDHTFDGELVGDVYHVFDVFESAGLKDADKVPYQKRHEGVQYLVGLVGSANVQAVPFATSEADKRALVKALQDGKREGVVFKRLDSFYLPGKIASLKKAVAIKIKFYTEGAFLVLDWNEGTSSVEVAAMDGKKAVSVGNVTIPAKYAEQVRKGEVLRVRYLYATGADQLFQPSLDADDAGSVVSDGSADKLTSLKHEGKDE